MNAPEVWWSPSLAEDLSQGGLIERTGPDLWHQEHGLWHRLDELPADVVRLVPDTGQADEVLKLRWEVQQLQGVVQDQHRAIAAVRSLCADAMKLPPLEDPRPADDRVSPRAVLAALDRAGPSPDAGQAPGVAALAEQARIPAFAAIDADDWPSNTARISAKIGVDYLLRELTGRALLGTDTPEADHG